MLRPQIGEGLGRWGILTQNVKPVNADRCLRAFQGKPLVTVDRWDRLGPVSGPVQKPHNLLTRCGFGPVGPLGPVKIEGVRSEIDEIRRRGAQYMAIVVSKCHGFFCPPAGRFLLVCASGTSENFSSELHKTTLQDLGKLMET